MPDFPPAQAPNFRRFAAHSVKWAVGQFGTIPLRFGAFLSPLALPSDSLVGFTGHNSPATRHSPLPPTTLPPWLLPDTDRRIVEVRTGPDLDERALYTHYAPNQAIPAHSSIRSFPLAAAHPLAVLSWPEALHVSGSRRVCLMHIGRNACSLVALPDFPEFAQAVRNGVPGTPTPLGRRR